MPAPRRAPDPSAVARTPPRQRSPNSDFVDFVHSVLDVAFLPVTYPLRLIRNVVTSPLTISVALRGILALLLILACAAFSVLAVGAFWWSWGTGGAVEVEGWLVYGAKTHRTPHALLPLPVESFQEDLPYDVQIELELVRPSRGSEEMGNFMVTLELRSARQPDTAIVHVAQPSLPPPPLPSSLFHIPHIPTWLMPPCVLPWPFRALCPGRILGYAGVPDARIKERRRRGTLVSPARGNEVVLLTKELLEGIVIAPGRGDLGVGAAFVSIGREDVTDENRFREVRTTGWVVVRFVPRPTGLRWLLTSNPIPPLLLLPPVSLTLTIASALLGFLVISCCGRKPKREKERPKLEARRSSERERETKREAEPEADIRDASRTPKREPRETDWSRSPTEARLRALDALTANRGEVNNLPNLRMIERESAADTETETAETATLSGTMTAEHGSAATATASVTGSVSETGTGDWGSESWESQ